MKENTNLLEFYDDLFDVDEYEIIEQIFNHPDTEDALLSLLFKEKGVSND